jgi:hypothetical protein
VGGAKNAPFAMGTVLAEGGHFLVLFVLFSRVFLREEEEGRASILAMF